jgi:hypothetical protein
VSVYTPQIGEQTPEMLAPEDRVALAGQLPALAARHPKLLFQKGLAEAFLHPPKNPGDCVFAEMSVNYSADLETRVEPCVFGGTPDCSQCGCAISSGLHWIRNIRLAGPVKVDHFIESSVKIGLLANRLRSRTARHTRWTSHSGPGSGGELVQIESGD